MSELRWPRIVPVVVAHLEQLDILTAAHEQRPRDHKMNLPYAVILRGPGTDDGVTDTPAVDVEIYAADVDQMWDAAEEIREAMHRLAGSTAGPTGAPVLVDTVRTSVSANEVPYGPDVRRAIATYRLGLRKRPVTP